MAFRPIPTFWVEVRAEGSRRLPWVPSDRQTTRGFSPVPIGQMFSLDTCVDDNDDVLGLHQIWPSESSSNSLSGGSLEALPVAAILVRRGIPRVRAASAPPLRFFELPKAAQTMPRTESFRFEERSAPVDWPRVAATNACAGAEEIARVARAARRRDLGPVAAAPTQSRPAATTSGLGVPTDYPHGSHGVAAIPSSDPARVAATPPPRTIREAAASSPRPRPLGLST